MTINSLDDLIEQKIILNKRLIDVNKISYSLFKLSKTLRYTDYILKLRDRVASVCRVVPLLNSQIILPQLERINLVDDPKDAPSGGSSLNRLVFPSIDLVALFSA